MCKHHCYSTQPLYQRDLIASLHGLEKCMSIYAMITAGPSERGCEKLRNEKLCNIHSSPNILDSVTNSYNTYNNYTTRHL
jgi:hypothetical protein